MLEHFRPYGKKVGSYSKSEVKLQLNEVWHNLAGTETNIFCYFISNPRGKTLNDVESLEKNKISSKN